MELKIGDKVIANEKDELHFEKGEILEVIEIDVMSKLLTYRFKNMIGKKSWLYRHEYILI